MARDAPRQHYGFKGIQQDHNDDDNSDDAREDTTVVTHMPVRN